MYPEICKIGPFTIYSYGLMLVVAFAVSSTLAVRQARREGFAADIIFNLLFISLIWGIIGSRIFYVLENARYYLKNPQETIMLQHGGLSWFGGLWLALISSIIFLRKKKLSVYKTFDLLAPFAALAQAIGRIGCLLNGCCFGRTIIPLQIYSSLILLVIFIILRFLQKRPHRRAEIFFTYLILYSLKRFFIEFWRLDNPVIFFGLTLFQLISSAVFFFSLSKLTSLIKSKELKCKNIS